MRLHRFIEYAQHTYSFAMNSCKSFMWTLEC